MKNYFLLLAVASIFTACSKNDGPKTTATIANTTQVSIKGVRVGYMNGAEGRARLLANIGDVLSGQETTFQITNDTVSQVLLYLDADSKTYMVPDPYPIVKGSSNPIIISTTTPAVEIEPTSPLFPQ